MFSLPANFVFCGFPLYVCLPALHKVCLNHNLSLIGEICFFPEGLSRLSSGSISGHLRQGLSWDLGVQVIASL